MLTHESPSVSLSRRESANPGGHPLRSAVWVRGDHDITTKVHLAVAIAKAARLDDAEVVVDLSGVTFMDASTIGALVVARNRLRARARSLSVRAPSSRARRLLDLCGMAFLIDENAEPAQPPVATALGSWVAVPTRDRSPGSTRPSAARQVADRERARAMAQRQLEPAGPVAERRPPS